MATLKPDQWSDMFDFIKKIDPNLLNASIDWGKLQAETYAMVGISSSMLGVLPPLRVHNVSDEFLKRHYSRLHRVAIEARRRKTNTVGIVLIEERTIADYPVYFNSKPDPATYYHAHFELVPMSDNSLVLTPHSEADLEAISQWEARNTATEDT